MKTLIRIPLVLTLSLACWVLLGSLAIAADNYSMVGSWHNMHPKPGEISMVVIAGNVQQGYTLQTFGLCRPDQACNSEPLHADVSRQGIGMNWFATAKLKNNSTLTLYWRQTAESEKDPQAWTWLQPSQGARVTMPNFRKSVNDFPYGYQTCRYGYVWREINSEDRVCAAPREREQAKRDNTNPDQDSKNHLGACPRGFVKRNMGMQDTVCVNPAVKAQILRDNAAQNARLLKPDFKWP